MPDERGSGEYHEHEDFSQKNYYEILGIEPTATQDEIKTAFRKLSIERHPDKGSDEKSYQFITEAYNTLKDPEKRAAYNSKIHIHRKHPDKSTDNPGSEDYTDQHGKNSERVWNSRNPFERKKEIFEHDGLTIVREGAGLLAKEYLVNPETKQKLGYTGYNRIFVRDGLVIAQSGSGLLKKEYLLNRTTGQAVHILGYDRIEKRNGRILGIKKGDIFSSQKTEEIIDRQNPKAGF